MREVTPPPRAVSNVEVNCPKVVESVEVLGPAKFALLNTSKASRRAWKCRRSNNWTFLDHGKILIEEVGTFKSVVRQVAVA